MRLELYAFVDIASKLNNDLGGCGGANTEIEVAFELERVETAVAVQFGL